MKEQQGRYREAIELRISALAGTTSRKLGDMFENIPRLRETRKQIGEKAFNTAVSELLDADSFSAFFELINNPDEPPGAS